MSQNPDIYECRFSILFLGTQMAIGGAQRVLLDQADWFHAHGHHVVAAFLYDRDQLHARWQAASAYPVYDLKAFRQGSAVLQQAFDLARGMLRLWQLLRREHFDVIETFTFDSNIPGMILSWLAGVPLRVATHHGKVGNVSRFQERLHLVIAKLTASVIVAVSSQVSRDLVSDGVDARKILVIPNGVSLLEPDAELESRIRRELKLNEKAIVLMSVGRLVFQKAHSVLVEAMQLVGRAAPDVVLYIAGEGPLRKALEEQIRAAGLTDRVHLLGNRTDIPELLGLADVFVLPSRWEGLPMALLEAMEAGVPVVATDVEGVEEVIEDGTQGFLVPPEDPADLSTALLKLIDNPPLRKRMGELARERVRTHYTTDVMCEKYLQMIVDRLGTDKARPVRQQPGISE